MIRTLRSLAIFRTEFSSWCSILAICTSNNSNYECMSESDKQILVSVDDRLKYLWQHTVNPALLLNSVPKHP